MKTLSLLLALAALSASAAEPALQDILDAHLKAIGGAEAHRKLKSSELRGRLEIAAMPDPATIVILSQAPDRQRVTIEAAGFGTIVEGFDGKMGWSKNGFTGLTEKTGDALTQARRQARFHRDIELAQRYKKLELVGREELQGKPVHVLRGTYAEGDTETLYLDAATHLIVQVKGRIVTPEGALDSRMELGDYRTVDGVKAPFLMRLVEPAPAAFTMKATELKHNVTVDEARFSKPAE
ncbi:MAG: hypothetical protein ACKVYV_16560 [Limisphaerales bacterium]